MKELLPELDAWTAEGSPIARAVVVRSFGSAPRPEGAVLLVAGCATKSYVQQEIKTVNERVDTVETQVEATQTKLTDHDAQLAAIEKSGWGHTFRFVQPRNPAFWLFCWMILLGAVETFRNLSNGFESVGSATTFMVVLFGVYTLPWVFFLRNVDRWSKMPGKLALAAFVLSQLHGLCALFFLPCKPFSFRGRDKAIGRPKIPLNGTPQPRCRLFNVVRSFCR